MTLVAMADTDTSVGRAEIMSIQFRLCWLPHFHQDSVQTGAEAFSYNIYIFLYIISTTCNLY